jgi:hypothetical protein
VTSVIKIKERKKNNNIISDEVLKQAEQHGYGLFSLPDPINSSEGRAEWEGRLEVIGFELAPVKDIQKEAKEHQPRENSIDTEHVKYLDNLIHQNGGKLLKPIALKLDEIQKWASHLRILLGGFHRFETYEQRGAPYIAAWILKFATREDELDYTTADNKHEGNGKPSTDADLLRYLFKLKKIGSFDNLTGKRIKEKAIQKLRKYSSGRTDKARGKLVTQFMNSICPPQLEKKSMSSWKKEQEEAWNDTGEDKKFNKIYNDELNLTFQTSAVWALIGSVALHAKNKVIELKGHGMSEVEAKKAISKIPIDAYGVITGSHKLASRAVALGELTDYQKLGLIAIPIRTIIFKRQNNDGNETQDLYYDWDNNKKEFIKRGI